MVKNNISIEFFVFVGMYCEGFCRFWFSIFINLYILWFELEVFWKKEDF